MKVEYGQIEAPPPWEGAVAPEIISIQRVLARYVEINNIKFTLDGIKLHAEQVFQPECLLPVIALEANRIWQQLSKHPDSIIAHAGELGEEYLKSQDHGSYFPYIVRTPAVVDDASSTLRLLTFVLSARRLLGLKENQTIDLFPHIKQWDHIDWEGARKSGEMPDIPIPEGFDLDFQKTEFEDVKLDGFKEKNPIMPTQVARTNHPEHKERRTNGSVDTLLTQPRDG